MSQPENTVLIDTMYGQFYAFKGDAITKHLSKSSAYSRSEIAMVHTFLREGDNIIDVGAHIGTQCIPFATEIGDKGRIFAFEGDKKHYEVLCENIELNNKSHIITTFLGIVSDTDHKFKKVSPHDINTGEVYYVADTDDKEGEATDVLSINIDRLFKEQFSEAAINMIKVDTEGAELNVLKSCKSIIDRHRPIIYCELYEPYLNRFNTTIQEVEDFLSGYGYHFFKNMQSKNSGDDKYTIASLKHLKQVGKHFDLLAIHPDSMRYPKQYISFNPVSKFLVRLRNSIKRHLHI